ncbi:Gfo/Idh/MocA family oxidoreductase [Acuticoccus sp. MNP-M23]|uniref:Gfo/Idh/MocA family protein n=1 Tax=Acuticoccus sp. MNP-M23 TaxID=3072793 RepID=UPI0028163C8D|nr:Gfo/Idh/MocA family oxidoreductase [Acuticoccus sp. MNP-M23]WMS41989.1 Gfo/Idh/MocA family oxidoreductase [Acuticoccus sp. MNP-M23]
MAPIRLGMVGGGAGAFIGAVHRIAARLDGDYELVAGALASTPDRAKASGEILGLDPARCYGSFEEMAEAEAARADGIEAVSIVTPNHMHAAPAIAFLKRGIHVLCDKPLAATMEDAEALAAAARESRAQFILTHNYTGYPMVRQARAMVTAGDLGDIRVVHVSYLQDWLTTSVESTGVKQAEWRTDPARSGAGGAVGDIGTHAHNLACFVTGLSVERLAADLQSFGPGRALDNSANVLLRFAGGARGTLTCSQVAAGKENALTLSVHGSRGGLEWAQEEPNVLWFTPYGQPVQRLTRMGAGANEAANAVSRIPSGHPEGYLEGFANIYAAAAAAIRKGEPDPDLPGIEAGLSGMRFIAACVASSQQDAAWVGPV